MSNQTILVIARKYNDIIYAVSTSEFKHASERNLLIISQNPSNQFPLKEKFDKILRLEIPDVSLRSQFNLFKKIYLIQSELMCDTIFLSNIVLSSHQYIVKKSKCNKIILLEDGYMNYRSDIFDNNFKKDLFMRILGITKKVLLI